MAKRDWRTFEGKSDEACEIDEEIRQGVLESAQKGDQYGVEIFGDTYTDSHRN